VVSILSERASIRRELVRAPGPNVTICIAARADNNCFVTVSDQRLFYSEGMTAADRGRPTK
jgi:hypothetical protein